MKILIVRNYPNYIDIQHNNYNVQEIGLAKAIVRKGHQCDIVFWTDKEEKEIDFVFDVDHHFRVYYKKGKVFLKNAIFVGINTLIEQYDIIQPCEYNQIQSWLLAKKNKEKVVIYHGPYFSVFNKRYNAICRVFDLFLLKTYVKNNTKFIVKSSFANEFLLKKGIKQENITIIGVGIDLEVLKPTMRDSLPKEIQKINQSASCIKLLYIGRWEERRNIIFIFDILYHLIKKKHNVKLIMVGNGKDGYVQKCLRYAEKLKITDNIYRIKKLEQKFLSEIYKRTDIFLLPTKYEIFGMVLLESMYYGQVVISTFNGGSNMLIENEENGLIIQDDDPLKWVEIVQKCSSDVFYSQKLRLNAHNTISNHYTWDELVERFINAYRHLNSGEE